MCRPVGVPEPPGMGHYLWTGLDTRSMKQFIIPVLFSAAILFTTGMQAQTTKDGTQLQWKHQLQVVPGTITVDKASYPGHTISVFETDEKGLLDLWRADYTPISAAITSKPLKATGVQIPQLAEAPLTVYADANTDKKAKLTKLTLAFMLNDSTSLEDNGEQAKLMHELAVRLNRAVVQAQIDRYQKDLDKVGDKLGSTQSDVAKSQSKLSKSNSELEKLKSKRAKMERDNARVHGDVAGLEKKFALSNDPKDLQRLTKARQKLAKNESQMAKLMQQEAKVQGHINKQQSTLDSQAKKAGTQTESKEDLMRIVSELKRKLDNIR